MSKTIIVVDDESHMRRLVSYVLETAGHHVITVHNGLEALRHLADCASAENTAGHLVPDLLICDIAMPEMDGFETVTAIRADERWAQLPVVMLTARGQQRDIIRAREIGADAYLTKPFSSSELLNTVQRYLD